MSYLMSDEMIKILIDRISDYECDPEPQHDRFLEEIPNHLRLQLKHALFESYRAYTMEISRG